MKGIARVVARGSAYERGVCVGRALSDHIKYNYRSVVDMLEGDKADMTKYRDLADKNGAFIKKTYPAQWEEMRGIADGAGISMDEVVMINVPAYFMRGCCPQECSMILAMGGATSDGRVYMAKNRDMAMDLEQSLVEYHYEDGLVITETNGAGMMTYPGLALNSKGLACASTGFWSPKVGFQLERIGEANVIINPRHILEHCGTVREALEYIDTYPRMNGINLLIADENEGLILEAMADSYLVEWCKPDGVLYHTNHYTIEGHTQYNNDAYPSTYMRYARIGEMLAERAGRLLRFQDFLRILSDHKNAPLNQICRHATPEAQGRTLSFSICCIEDREVYSTPGAPCEHMPCSDVVSDR